jgi:hypothetical protein
MIVQIEMNDKKLAEFFKNAGYQTDIVPVQDWRDVGHNGLKEIMVDTLHVITKKGEKKPAKEVFRRVMELRAVYPDQITINQVKRVLEED